MIATNDSAGLSRHTQHGARRDDIQGLRAIAVLLVVAFHAGLPVPGGFIGVDVFFVISGFVITSMIRREHTTTGQFSFGRFYLRRFKRLTPALSLMVATTLILSFCLLSPFAIQQIAAQTGFSAMFIVANFAIVKNTGDYFDALAELNPFLHTWSLSAEEQFYLAFPAVLVVGWWFSRSALRRIPWVPILVIAIGVLSFVLTMADPESLDLNMSKYILGFYSPFTRAWEFAAGAIAALATAECSLRSVKQARFLGCLGVGLLAPSAWLIDSSTDFPGPWTVLPVVGTLLLIIAGTNHSTTVNRALASSVMVKIGDWSYSIYLWHWPLKVIAVHLWPDVPFVPVAAASLSIIPAVASYRFVEQPFRRLPSMSRQRTSGIISAVIFPTVLLSAGAMVGANNFWLPRYNSGTVAIRHHGDTEWIDLYQLLERNYYPCSDKEIQENALKWQGISRCRQSKPSANVDVAIIGDSHAEQLFLGLAEASPRKNIAYYIINGLPIRSTTGMNRIIEHTAADPAIRTVIVTAEWSRRGVPSAPFANTLSILRQNGKQVFVTDDVPVFDFEATECKFRISPVIPISRCSEGRKLFDKSYSAYGAHLREVAGNIPEVHLVETAAYFCTMSLCSMNKADALLYRDSNHLNNIGSRFVASQLISHSAQLRAALALD